MYKFLFTDGVNGVKELQSQEELEQLIDDVPVPEACRIWVFNTQEWISYAAYRQRFPFIKKRDATAATAVVMNSTRPSRAATGKNWLKKFLFIILLPAGAFLVFNFTKVKWKPATPVNFVADRPANVPVMDMDSLIEEIEYDRGEELDRSTRTNLRTRNTWPDKIELKLHAERETGNSENRYSHIDVSVDNSTGFNLDNAIVNLSVWKNHKLYTTDTVKFNMIGNNGPMVRTLSEIYRGDSISVSFASIRAKAFNFCYSSSIKNNSGNYNDRWFCRE